MGISFKKFTRWTGNLITNPGKAIKDFTTGIHNASKDLNDWWNGLINPDVPEPITGVLLNRSASNAAIPVVYGSRRVGGQRVYLSTGGDKNKYVYIVLALAEGPITAVRDIEINSKPLVDFGSKARISIHLGTDDQAADADFVLELDDWTEAHKLSGIAYLACRFEYDSDLFSGIPTITGVVDGRALYDPRSDSTAFSQNHALVILDYLRNTRYGVSVPDAEINFDAFKAAADICDEVSETAAASNVFVSRFACNYVLSTDKTRLDNIKTLVSACRGFLPYQNGQYALTIVNDDTVVFEFDERHIVGEVAIQPPSKRTRNNRITAKFVNPDRNWKEDEVSWPTDQALYEQFLEEDNGIELETSLTLDNVTSPYQALDIARQACLESRASLTVAFTATQEALAAYVGRVVSLSYGSLGFDQKLFRVESREISSEVTVQISLVEFDPTIYPWADLPTIDPVKPVTLPDPLNLPSIAGLSFTPSAYNSVQCGVLSWDESQSAYVDRYRVEVVNKSSGVLVFATTVSETTIQVPNVLAGNYQAIVRGVSALSRTPAATVDFSFSVPALETPTNLHQVGSFDNALTLAWDGIVSDALARYQIQIIADVSTVLATFSSTEPRYVIELAMFENLSFPRSFVVSVASVNVAGVVSDPISISVNKAAPSAPQSVTLWEGVNQAELIYSLPSNANGVSVWLDTDDQAERTNANLVYRGNDLRTTLSGLTPETTYYVWIASYDAFGTGPVTSLAFNTLADAVAQTLDALESITNQLDQASQSTINKVEGLDTRLDRVNRVEAINADAILENVVKSAEIEQKAVTLEQSSAQLRYEQTLLAEADQALAQTITNLDAEFENNKAAVGQQLTALADADQTIAQSVTDLDAEFESNKTSVEQQLTTLASADQTIAQSVTDLDAEFESNKASVEQQLTTLANADQTIAQSVTDLDAEFESNKTSVEQQLTTLANADQTIAQSVTDLDAEFESNKTSVDQQLTTLANADQTIAQSVTDLDAEFESNKTSVYQQLTALANADQTIAQSVTDLDTEFETNKTSVDQQLTALADADQTIAQSVTDLDAEFETNKTSVDQQLTALANADQTIAQSVTDLDAEFESNKATVNQQLTSLASADQTSAEFQRLISAKHSNAKRATNDKLLETVVSNAELLTKNTDLEQSSAQLSYQQTVLADEDQALAESVEELAVQRNQDQASLEDYKRTSIGYCSTGEHKTAAECEAAGHTWVTSPLAEAMQRALIEIADESGNVSTAQAGQLFQTLVNETGGLQATASLFAIVKDQLAGLFVNVGQGGSDMQFLADKFTFKTGGSTKTPLQIVGETLELVNAVVRSSLNINDRALIDSDGTAYFEDGSFRGHVEATSGTFTGHVEAESGSFTGHVDATSGSFSGSLKAVQFDTDDGRIKSIFNDSYGPLTTIWSEYNVYSSGGTSVSSMDLGTLYLPNSTDESELKISTKNGRYLVVTGLVSFKDSKWTMQYQLDDGDWLDVADAPTIIQNYPSGEVKIFPWSFSVKLFGTGGIAEGNYYKIAFRLARTGTYNSTPRLNSYRITFWYNNM